ncbi:hypothetical protein D3868_06135 [Azospirillum brasilense]|uniref:Uncharacterized protein n=1 Tax=Azospirillum brasilense TaxID=192 RepID=A0A4D8QHE1_AZOBR|nr:hypothetical protein D3868_06135 [Azospirillum brasilense]
MGASSNGHLPSPLWGEGRVRGLRVAVRPANAQPPHPNPLPGGRGSMRRKRKASHHTLRASKSMRGSTAT